jgi:hypothetical protein
MLLARTALALLLLTPAFSINNQPPEDALVIHEWGTFTTVTGADGAPVRWMSFLGPPDLPCFVERLGDWNPKLLSGIVRMETPVLYFYTLQPLTVSVGVQFPKGWITEWYPRASKVRPRSTGGFSQPGASFREPFERYGRGEIHWDAVNVVPGADPQFPRGQQPSPYYAARHTDAAPLRIGEQHEKLIFYRGIGDFDVPLRAWFADGAWQVRNVGPETIPLAILFENRDGKIGYRKLPRMSAGVRLESPPLAANLAGLQRELAADLVEFGLYRREAEAMLETWSDSWFEEGTRIIYIVPRPLVDSVLPLRIDPTPKNVARVFVGRAELLAPWMRRRIVTAVSDGNTDALEKLGRFLAPFASQIERTTNLSRATLDQVTGNLLQQQFRGQTCVQ